MNSFFKRVKTWATSNPLIYKSYFRLLKPSLKKYLPNSETDLFISAYPRSGNDYVKQLTKNYNSRIKISSHFHKVGAFKLAIKLGIPTVAVIRDPVECISSSMVKYREELKLKQLPTYPIYDYIFFHKALLKYRRKITILSFEAIIKDPIYYYLKLENELGINNTNDLRDLKSIQLKVNDKLNDSSFDHNNIDALKKGPDPGKELLKAEAKAIIDKNTKMKTEAIKVYNKLIKCA